jgi:hypothetical protein
MVTELSFLKCTSHDRCQHTQMPKTLKRSLGLAGNTARIVAQLLGVSQAKDMY